MTPNLEQSPKEKRDASKATIQNEFTQMEGQVPPHPQASISKSSVSIVVLGSEKAGKSTLMGHLLVQSGKVDQKTIDKFERDNATSKFSNKFARIMDQTKEQKKTGYSTRM